MSSQQGATTPGQPPTPPAGIVRRHHTITAASRSARAARDPISEDDPNAVGDLEHWTDDEVVDADWPGAVGAVGEKSLLHRQSSLPTRYHRGKPVSFAHPLLSVLLNAKRVAFVMNSTSWTKRET